MKPLFVLASLFACGLAQAQIVLNQTDDFQDGTLQGWGGGASPQNVANGGPNGAGDRFLQLTSFGGIGGGSRLASFNVAQWTGSYNAAGVDAVEVWMKNLGSTPLEMRIVLFDFTGGDTRWTSTVSQTLPVGGAWQKLTFSIKEADLTRVQGTQTYAALMLDVDRLMFRHQAGAPAPEGDPIAASVGLDAIKAIAQAPPVQIVNPASYVVTDGNEPVHDLNALLLSDDVRLLVISNFPAGYTTAIEYTTTAPAMTVNRLSFILEHHSNEPGRRRVIELWNYTTNAWEIVSDTPGTTTDSTIVVDVTTNPTRFIDAATREMKTRTRLFSSPPQRKFRSIIDRIDRAVWELSG
jgi:hypothetical protein